MSDRSLLPAIGADYEEGRDRYGVFGTPTFVFPNGQSAYLKLLPASDPSESLTVFEDFTRFARDRPNLLEIKRPRRPE